MKPPDREVEMRLSYAIKFVSDMDSAVAFYRDTLGMTPRFQSPFWSEFETGQTTLALHPASDENPAGTVQLGLGTDDIDAFYRESQGRGLTFTEPPRDLHGSRVARLLDPEGAEISIGGVKAGS
jgi:catechol 2,3-dioxygenase-like lactoylglutathione lyase family enzyme